MAGRTTRVLIALAAAAIVVVPRLLAQDPSVQAVTLRAQVAASPVWSGSTYVLPLRESTAPGTLVRGTLEQFRRVEPGDWVEIRGRVTGGVLTPDSFQKNAHDVTPPPALLSAAELSKLNLGQWIRTSGNVLAISERTEGRTLEIDEAGRLVTIFLPRPF